MPGRGGGTGEAAWRALLSLVVLSCCTVGGLSPALKTRLVSSALAPPSRHAYHLDVHASDAPWPNAPRPNAPRPNAPAGRTPGDDPTVWLPAFRYHISGPRLELRAADAAPENNGAHAHTEDEEALAPLPSPPSPAPPHGSAPPVQALVARALQKSMRSAPVPLKVYQASFVVKVRVVPAQPALSCASPLPELSLRPCPSVWAAAEQGKTAALQTAKQQSSTTSSVAVRCCAWMVCTEMMVLTTPTKFRLPTPVSLAPRGAWARSRRRRSPSSPLPPWRRRRCGRPARGR